MSSVHLLLQISIPLMPMGKVGGVGWGVGRWIFSSSFRFSEWIQDRTRPGVMHGNPQTVRSTRAALQPGSWGERCCGHSRQGPRSESGASLILNIHTSSLFERLTASLWNLLQALSLSETSEQIKSEWGGGGGVAEILDKLLSVNKPAFAARFSGC